MSESDGVQRLGETEPEGPGRKRKWLIGGVAVVAVAAVAGTLWSTQASDDGEAAQRGDGRPVALSAVGQPLTVTDEKVAGSLPDAQAALSGNMPAPEGAQNPIVVPERALEAYRKAEAGATAEFPQCGVPWWVLAGMAKVSSDHAAGTEFDEGGTTVAQIRGTRLDGRTVGTARVVDTDNGELDGDREYDRAMGPFQFLPGTWRLEARDGNGDGLANPDNIDDAALGGAATVCEGGDNLSEAEGLTRGLYRFTADPAVVNGILAWGSHYRTNVTPPAAPSTPTPSPEGEEPVPTTQPAPGTAAPSAPGDAEAPAAPAPAPAVIPPRSPHMPSPAPEAPPARAPEGDGGASGTSRPAPPRTGDPQAPSGTGSPQPGQPAPPPTQPGQPGQPGTNPAPPPTQPGQPGQPSTNPAPPSTQPGQPGQPSTNPAPPPRGTSAPPPNSGNPGGGRDDGPSDSNAGSNDAGGGAPAQPSTNPAPPPRGTSAPPPNSGNPGGGGGDGPSESNGSGGAPSRPEPSSAPSSRERQDGRQRDREENDRERRDSENQRGREGEPQPERTDESRGERGRGDRQNEREQHQREA